MTVRWSAHLFSCSWDLNLITSPSLEMKQKNSCWKFIRWWLWLIFSCFLFIAGIIIYFHVENYIQQQNIKIGVLYDYNNRHERGFIQAIDDAIEDIFEESQNFFFQTKIVAYKRKKTETALDAFERFYAEGVRDFWGVRSDVYSSSGGNWTLHSSPLDMDSSGATDMVTAYLAVVNTSTPELEDVYLVPVMRDHPDDNDLYTVLLANARKFPRLRLITPIVFIVTEYSRSDAFQVML